MRLSENQVNKSVSIRGDVTNSIIQTGNQNVVLEEKKRIKLPPPNSVDIQADFEELCRLLTQLHSPKHKEIEHALEDARHELAKPKANRDKIGKALERALNYAKQAESFANVMGRLKPYIAGTVSWLGNNWHKLLSIVGFTLSR